MDRPSRPGLTRRTTLGLGLAALAIPARAGDGAKRYRVTVGAGPGGRPISPLIFGSNEIGAMDGGALSAELDRAAGVTFRRLGGNLTTTFDWATNISNAGKDWNYANGRFLPDAMRLAPDARDAPLGVISAMHEASLAMGARSLVTVPLAGYVAADADGPVSRRDAAPSRRFKPVRWDLRTPAGAPIDPKVCDVSHLLARLLERYGGASSERGVYGYSLDNEPDLWAENHPRVVPSKPTIAALIQRSVTAARVIKAIDPAARVFGPASWGASGFTTFQSAPDWRKFADRGSFLAAYLDAFRTASERDGVRLLDALDIHWYPFSRKGDLLRTEDPGLADALLDAPRSLSERGFVENSWVPDVLPPGREDGLGLPILPSLRTLVDRWFPGTEIAITEFNFGGAGQVASGLALADSLGRFSAEGVGVACHWGSLPDYLGEAYRLFTSGGGFGGRAVPVETGGGPELAAYAARRGGETVLAVVNTSPAPAVLDCAFSEADRAPATIKARGFDAVRRIADDLDEPIERTAEGFRTTLPPRSARRYALG